MKPTPEQMNIALCEIAGWTFHPSVDVNNKATHECWTHEVHDISYSDYPEDYLTGPEALGNLHELWKTLTRDQHGHFRTQLQFIVFHDGCTDDNPHRSVSNATAPQRAEALFRVLRPEIFEEGEK